MNLAIPINAGLTLAGPFVCTETDVAVAILSTWQAGDTNRVINCVTDIRSRIENKKASLGIYTIEVRDGACWITPV